MTMTTVIHKTGLGVNVAGAALAIIGALIQSAALWQPGLVMFTAGFASVQATGRVYAAISLRYMDHRRVCRRHDLVYGSDRLGRFQYHP